MGSRVHACRKPRLVFPLLFTSFFFSSLVQKSLAATSNIETFFPSTQSPIFSPPTPLQSPHPPSPQPPPTSPSAPPPPTKRDTDVTKAVVATAAISFALWGLLFFVLYTVFTRRRELKTVERNSKSSRLQLLRSKAKPARLESVVVDKDGLDVIYLREFNGAPRKCNNCINKVLSLDVFSDPFVSNCSRSSTATTSVAADAVHNNVEHSMAWNKVTDGSFRFDEGIMEALFGTLANTTNMDPKGGGAFASAANLRTSPSQVFLLDPRKAHSIAIVLRSLGVSRQEICDALVDGRGLSGQTLEKLAMFNPDEEEEAIIRAYAGEPSKLSDAEALLFHVLRHVPAPFARVDAMLFMFNYDTEMLQLWESLGTLDLACKELKTRGLFPKLLEAVLNAGNLMNAETATGSAQAFNLTALCKLSDVQSTDGSTTLLHFVVEEVVRAEGKRLAINRDYSLCRPENVEDAGADAAKLERTMDRDERENIYMKLGLSIIGGLSDEFIKLKTAVGIDYDALVVTCPSLAADVAQLKRFLDTCDGNDGFMREMRSFVERAEEELMAARAEQKRVLELVKKTTEYYQLGTRKDTGAHPFQVFRIVRSFLGMVDMACIDITRNLQKKKLPAAAAAAAAATTSSGTSQTTGSRPGIAVLDVSDSGRRPAVRFPYLPPHFTSMSDSSSDEEDGQDH